MMAVGGSEEEISSEEEDNQACLDNFAIESAKVALLKEQEPWLNTSYKVELQFEENSNDSMTWVTIQGKKVDRDHSKIYIKCLCNPNMTFRMNYPLEMRATLTDHDLHATFEKRYGVAILFKDDGTAIIQDADNVSFALALSAIEDFIGSGETVEDPSHPSTGSKLLAEQLERMASQDESVIVDDNFQQQPNAVKRSMLDFCKDHDSSVIMLEDSDKADEPSTSTQVQGKRKKKKKKKKKKNPVHSGSDSEVITDLEDHMKKDLLHSKTNLKIEISQKGKSRKVCEAMDPNFLEIAKDKGYTTDEISAIVENYGCDLLPSEFFHRLLDMRLAKESASTDSDSVAKTPAVVVLGSKHKKVVDILSEDDEDIPILHPVQEMFSGSSSCGSPVLKHRRVHSPAKAETATKSLPDLAPEYWEKLSDHMEREDDSCIKQLKKNNEERRIALQSVRPDVEMKANNVDTGMEHISQDKNNCKLGGDPAAHSAERSSSKKRSISSGRTSPKPPASANKGGNKSHSKPSPAEASTSATVRSVNGSNKTCNNKDNGPKKSSSDSKKSSSSSAKHKTVTTNMAAPHPQYQPTNMSDGPSSLPSVMGAEAPVFPSSDAVNDFICVDDNVPSDSMIDNVLVNVVNQPATATAGARQYGEHVSPLMALEESSTSQAASTSNNKRYIVIDGSNVAMCHGNQKIFSCKGIELCINYFKSCGHKEITAFVPQWRQRTIQNDRIPIRDQHILEELRESGNLVYTPARRVPGKNIVCYDDKFVLRLAEQTDGIIVSNDNYRDLWEEKREWRHIIETRLLMFSFVGDLFMPPDDPLGRNGPSLDHLLHKHPEDQPGYNNWQRSRTNYNRGGSGARPKHPQNKSKFPIGVWNEPTNISHRNPHSKPVKDNYKVGYMGPIGRGRGGRGTSNYESYAGQIGSMAGPSTTQHGHNFTSPPDYWAPNAPNKKPAPLSQHQPHNNSPHGGESQSKGSTGPARRSSLETDELFKVLFETFPQRTTAIDSILKKYPCVRDIDRLSGYLLDSL